MSIWGGRAFIHWQNTRVKEVKAEGRTYDAAGNLVGTLESREKLSYDRAEGLRAELTAQSTNVTGLQIEVATWENKYSTLRSYYTRMRERYKEMKTSIDSLSKQHQKCEAQLSQQIITNKRFEDELAELRQILLDLNGIGEIK